MKYDKIYEENSYGRMIELMKVYKHEHRCFFFAIVFVQCQFKKQRHEKFVP